MLPVTSLTVAGDHNVVVDTWRPSGHRVVDKLRRFFIGGGPELDNLDYITQSSDFIVKINDKIISHRSL